MREHRASLPALLLVLATAAAGAASAQDLPSYLRDAPEPSTAELIAAAPEESAYPAADAVVLYESIRHRLDADGRAVRRVRRVTKVFTEWAVRGLGDVRIQWDALRQEPMVPVCRTFRPDGREVVTPDRGLNEVTPDGVAHCAGHLSIRELVISHVGIERGAVLELVYEIRDHEPAPLGPSGLIYLQDGLPALRREVQVQWHPDLGLVWASLNGAPEAESFASLVHLDAFPGNPGAGEPGPSWFTVGVGPVPPLPPEGGWTKAEQVPAVAFSVHRSWEALGGTLAAASGLPAAPDPALAAWLRRELASEEATADLAGVEKVAELAAEGLRPAGAPDRWLRAPRSPHEVLRGGCGTEWERMVLAHALLRAAGLAPELVLPGAAADLPAGVAAPELLGAPRVRVEAAGRTRWLSPASAHPQVSPADLAGLPRLVLADRDEPELAARLEPAPEQAEASSVLSARLRPATGAEDEDAWDLELDYAAAGACHRPDDGSDPDAIALQLARGLLEEPEVISTNLLEKSPDRLHLRATVRGSLAGLDEGLAVLPLPRGPRGVLDLLPAGARLTDPARSLPLRVRQPVVQQVELVVELPEGAAADPLPAVRDLTLAGARFRQQAAVEAGRVRILRTLRLPAGEVAPRQWPELRRLLVESSRLDASSLGLRLP